MKKVLSLLMVALLAMSAWANTVVTIDFSAQGYDNGQKVTELTVDGVTLTFDKGSNSNNAPAYFNTGDAIRLYGGNTMTVTAEQNIKKIDFVFSTGEDKNKILSDVGSYNIVNAQWTIGSSDPSTSVVFTIDGTSGHRRVHKLMVTTEDADPVSALVPPVFNPNGGEFIGSLEVTLSCATENASIYYFEGTPEGDWAGFEYYDGPFYVTETKTYTAYASKGGELSEYVTVTFTKVEQTVEAPVFTPAAGSFQDRIEVTLACATPNAKIYYSLDNELWSEYVDPIPVTDDITIWAKAKVGDVESEVVSATYTKLPATTVDVTFDATVDKGNGSTERGEYTIVKDGVTMYVGDGTVYSDHYRIYAGDNSAFSFTSAGAPIVKIEFEGVSGNPASNMKLAEGYEGTFTTTNPDGVWEGSANEVAFEITKQARFYTITVTLAGGEEPVYEIGDVNHDGKVNIADVTALIDYLLTDPEAAPAEGDVMADGKVNIADVTALIDYLLTTQE